MMLLLALAAGVVAAQPFEPTLAEASHAIGAGRMDQARALVAKAMQQGAGGDSVERLLADIEFATGKDASALARYEVLLKTRPTNASLLEHAGIAALRLGRNEQARDLLDRALAVPGATWRAWSARGVLADRLGDWEGADRAYAYASRLAPAEAEVANNHGWSLMVRGRWADAVVILQKAAQLDPKSEKIADNLDLARMAVAGDLPRRRAGESNADWAARLNDAGVIAGLQGDRKRAVAAFARAIRAKSSWYERAANNLAAAEGK